MSRNYFNDDSSRKGIEGEWWVENGKLIFYVSATNCKEDWLSNFTAFPVWDKNASCFVHAGYKKYTAWLSDFILKVSWDEGFDMSEVLLVGYSMGGGIAQIVGRQLLDINIVSIDGPRTTSKLTDEMKLIFNCGSLVHNVPLWFKRIKNIAVLNDKWRPFWESHGDYNIFSIINREIYP